MTLLEICNSTCIKNELKIPDYLIYRYITNLIYDDINDLNSKITTKYHYYKHRDYDGHISIVSVWYEDEPFLVRFEHYDKRLEFEEFYLNRDTVMNVQKYIMAIDSHIRFNTDIESFEPSSRDLEQIKQIAYNKRYVWENDTSKDYLCALGYKIQI